MTVIDRGEQLGYGDRSYSEPWPGSYVPLADCEVFVRTAAGEPEAEPVVLIHGLSGAATNYTAMAGHLAGDFAAHAVDLPGFGRSAPPVGGDYSLAANAEVVRQFIVTLGRPAHLVGNSLGGAVVIEVAARWPELLASATLISPAVPDLRLNPRRVSDARMFGAFLPVVGRRFAAELAAEPLEERARRTIELIFGDPSLVGPAELDAFVGELAERGQQHWVGEATSGAFLGLLRRWVPGMGESLWRTAERVTVPTLVLWGSEDKVITARLAQRLAARIPNSRLTIFTGVGHCAQLERPEAVARAVRELAVSSRAGTW